MKDYSYGEIAKMQFKALEDAKEMSSRSSFPNDDEAQKSTNENDCEKCKNCKNFDCVKNPNKKQTALSVKLDDDKLLLIALLLILSKDCSDKSMFLALAYILL